MSTEAILGDFAQFGLPRLETARTPGPVMNGIGPGERQVAISKSGARPWPRKMGSSFARHPRAGGGDAWRTRSGVKISRG